MCVATTNRVFSSWLRTWRLFSSTAHKIRWNRLRLAQRLYFGSSLWQHMLCASQGSVGSRHKIAITATTAVHHRRLNVCCVVHYIDLCSAQRYASLCIPVGVGFICQAVGVLARGGNCPEIALTKGLDVYRMWRMMCVDTTIPRRGRIACPGVREIGCLAHWASGWLVPVEDSLT